MLAEVKRLPSWKNQRLAGNVSELTEVFARIKQIAGQEHVDPLQTEIGSMVYAVKPCDGSAREQAASCQRVIGGLANIAEEYATKRYRSNVINWGCYRCRWRKRQPLKWGLHLHPRH